MSNELRMSVLCPSGHTVSVRVSPTDPVHKILATACKKRQLDPSSHYLQHHGKRLDCALPLRFSNLPNQGRLSLVEFTDEEKSAQAAAGAKAKICLELPCSTRVDGEFELDVTLLHVVEQLDTTHGGKNSGDEPGIIYVAREIFGNDALSQTTIRSLGVRAGCRERLKVFYRNPNSKQETLPTTFNAQNCLPVKVARGESPPRRAMRVDEGGSMLARLIDREKGAAGDDNPLRSDYTSPRAMEVEEAAVTTFLDSAAQGDDAMTAMPCPEVSEKPEERTTEEPEEGDVEKSSEKTIEQAASAMEQPNKVIEEPATVNFLDEKHRMLVCDTDGQGQIPRIFDHLEDEDFELTIEDVSKRHSQLKEEAKRYTEGRPLVSKGTLETQEKERRAATKFKKTLIRITFPDRMLLQAVFDPHQTIADVKSVVSSFLAPDVGDFDLVTPPSTLHRPQQTLLQCQCVPSTNLRFTQASSLRRERYFKEDVLNRLSTYSDLAKAANDVLQGSAKLRKPDSPCS